MSALLDKNPEYSAVTIITVDWDEFKDAPIVSELAIPRRSTLVMFNQGEEVSRVVAETDSNAIEAMFKAVV